MKTRSLAKILSLLIGLSLIITGVMFLFNPIAASLTIVTWLGILLLVTGIMKVVRYFSHDNFRKGGFLVSAILDIILGVYVLRHNIVSIKALGVVIGFWQLFSGISSLAAAIDLKRAGLARWWVGIVTGTIGIIFGYVLIRNMEIATMYMSAIVAVNMVVYGSSYIMTYAGIDGMDG